MSKYTGSQCIICQNLFREEDDIVVCPECGTPYHRSCYQSAGQCVNEKLHASGVSWQQQRDATREKIGGRECPNCHHTNVPGAQQCEVCYHRFEEEAGSAANGRPGVNIRMADGSTYFYDGTDPTCGLPKDEMFEEERLEDIANFVRDNTLIHLFNFKKFKETGKKIAFNLWALLCPHLFFAHRKMWLASVLVILISAVLGIPSMLGSLYTVLDDPEQLELMMDIYQIDMLAMFGNALPFLEAHADRIGLLADVSNFLTVALRIVLCLFANWMYYRHVLRRVKKIRLGSATEHDKTCILKAEGGASFWNVVGALGLYFLITTLVNAAVMAPFMTIA